MWMGLETVIEHEVKSEREKQILFINTCMWNIDGLICKAEMETQIENKCLGSKGEQG